jgi:hypothetical protein
VILDLPETANGVVIEGFFIADDVGVSYGGQKANLVDGVVNLSLG